MAERTVRATAPYLIVRYGDCTEKWGIILNFLDGEGHEDFVWFNGRWETEADAFAEAVRMTARNGGKWTVR